MAEEENNENEPEELDDAFELGEGEGKKGKKKLIIVILLIVALLGIGAGIFFFMSGDEEHAEAEPTSADEVMPAEEHAEGEEGEGAGLLAPSGPVFYKLPEFVVNLNVGARRTSFLKTTITLELPNEEVAKKVDALQPRIVDSFNTYLRELRASDLGGSAGMYRLREELMIRINKTLHPDQIDDILFTELMVQ